MEEVITVKIVKRVGRKVHVDILTESSKGPRGGTHNIQDEDDLLNELSSRIKRLKIYD